MATPWTKLAADTGGKPVVLKALGLTETAFVGWVPMTYPGEGDVPGYDTFEEAAVAADKNGIPMAHREFLTNHVKVRANKPANPTTHMGAGRAARSHRAAAAQRTGEHTPND